MMVVPAAAQDHANGIFAWQKKTFQIIAEIMNAPIILGDDWFKDIVADLTPIHPDFAVAKPTDEKARIRKRFRAVKLTAQKGCWERFGEPAGVCIGVVDPVSGEQMCVFSHEVSLLCMMVEIIQQFFFKMSLICSALGRS